MTTKITDVHWARDMAAPMFGDSELTRSAVYLARVSLQRIGLLGGAPSRHMKWEGECEVDVETFLKSFAADPLLGKLHLAGQDGADMVFASADTCIEIVFVGEGEDLKNFRVHSAELVSSNARIFEAASKLFCSIKPVVRVDNGTAYALVRESHGYGISAIGSSGADFAVNNYSDRVGKDFAHVVEDLKSASPCGRLAIFSGEPGTGKTYLVRSLLRQAPDALFVLVPSYLVRELNGPELLPVLINNKRHHHSSVVLVIEDADQCLVKRGESNMDSISTMLNLGDGIIGATLDLRIVATTNASTLEMDPATRRAGRLCRHIHVGPLDREPAIARLRQLTAIPDAHMDVPNTGATLAEVYAHARALGWKAA